MDKVKQWVALTVVGVLAILAGGWFLLVSPKKSDARDLQAQADSKIQANSVLRTQLAMLKAQAKTLPQQQAALAAVAAKIPDNPEMPRLIRALNAAAKSADVELVSLAPSPPAPVAAAPSTSVAVAPAGAAGPAGAARPVASGAAAGTLNSIPVVISVAGGYFQVEQFIDQLESLQRAFKVTALSMVPGDNPVTPPVAGAASAATTGKSLTVTINGTVYMATGRVTSAAAPTTAK